MKASDLQATLPDEIAGDDEMVTGGVIGVADAERLESEGEGVGGAPRCWTGARPRCSLTQPKSVNPTTS